MRPSFLPRLVNPPIGDPVLFISFQFENRAILFDLGDIQALSPREILKTSHVFITHTHMDHFIGFDKMLRLLLGREKDLYLYGPEGLIANVEGKLAGYSWNLVDNFTNRFTLHVAEVLKDECATQTFQCSKAFRPEGTSLTIPFDGVLLREPSVSVSVVSLDHKIPCLGYAICERFHVNIKKNSLFELGLDTGPWLNGFKQALFNHKAPESEFQVPPVAVLKGTGKFLLGDLTDRIAMIAPGQKVAYVVDAICSDENLDKIVELARNADHLFIEAAFLEKDRSAAEEKYHLTAGQAGRIARRAGVKRFSICHVSPRYTGEEHLLEKEAEEAFRLG